MSPPPYGLAVPASWSHLTRADQIVCLIRNRRVRVDLLGCRAPSPRTPDGTTARHWLEAWLESNAHLPLTVWLPLPASGRPPDLGGPRLSGRVFCGTTDLSALLVTHGHAQPISGDSFQN